MSLDMGRFETEAANWDEVPGRVKMARDIAQAIIDAGIINADMNVLDFGCGTGLLTLQIQPLVHSITGVDNSAGMLEVLQKKIESQNLNHVMIQNLNIEQGDEIKGSYDLIVSSMTLHHIREVKPLLDQFCKILVPQGYLCIADLDPDDGQFHADNNGVFHRGFDRNMLRGDFAEAGFDVVEIKTAAEVMKPAAGGTRLFSIFLAIGQKG